MAGGVHSGYFIRYPFPTARVKSGAEGDRRYLPEVYHRREIPSVLERGQTDRPSEEQWQGRQRSKGVPTGALVASTTQSLESA